MHRNAFRRRSIILVPSFLIVVVPLLVHAQQVLALETEIGRMIKSSGLKTEQSGPVHGSDSARCKGMECDVDLDFLMRDGDRDGR